MPKLYSAGSVNIDQYCWIGDGIANSQPIVKYKRQVGGKGINQVEAVRRAGIADERIQFIGIVGNDGEWVLNELHAQGFPTSHIHTCNDELTGHVVVVNQLSDGAMRMFYYAGANARIPKEMLFGFIRDADRGSVLLVQNEMAGMRELLARARELGMHICFNPSPGIDASWVKNDYQCTWLILNEPEYSHLCRLYLDERDDVRELRKLLHCEFLIVTLGARGAMGICQEGLISFPAIPVEQMVDSLGAGDTFAGYFIATFLDSEEWSFDVFKEAIEKAVMAAGLKVQRLGAFEGIPYDCDIEQYKHGVLDDRIMQE